MIAPNMVSAETTDRVQQTVDEMSLCDKITQMLMVDFRYWDEDLTDDVAQTGFTVMNDQVRQIVEDYNFGEIIGSELSVLGINTDLAPVVDVNNDANNPVIGLRSYGDDAVAVGEMAAASIAGMAEYNVIGCAKHFPGHGDTATDSHYGLPSVDKSLDVLLENELKPYEVAIESGIEMIMSADKPYDVQLYPNADGFIN